MTGYGQRTPPAAVVQAAARYAGWGITQVRDIAPGFQPWVAQYPYKNYLHNAVSRADAIRANNKPNATRIVLDHRMGLWDKGRKTTAPGNAVRRLTLLFNSQSRSTPAHVTGSRQRRHQPSSRPVGAPLAPVTARTTTPLPYLRWRRQ